MDKAMQVWRNIDIEGYEKSFSTTANEEMIIFKPTEKFPIFEGFRIPNVGTITIHLYGNANNFAFSFKTDKNEICCRNIGELFDTQEVFNNILEKLKEFKRSPYKKILNVENNCVPHHEIYFIRNNRYDVNIGVKHIEKKYNILIDFDMCKFSVEEKWLNEAIDYMIFKIERFLKSIENVFELFVIREGGIYVKNS